MFDTDNSDLASDAYVGIIVLLFAILPLFLIPFTFAFAGGIMRNTYQKARGLVNQVGSKAADVAVKRPLREGKEELRGRAASMFNTNTEGMTPGQIRRQRLKNLAARVASGSPIPTASGSRKAAAYSLKYRSDQLAGGEALLTATGVGAQIGDDVSKPNSGGLAKVMSGQNVGKISGRDQVTVAAATKKALDQSDDKSIIYAMQNPATPASNRETIRSTLMSNYGAAKAINPGLVKMEMAEMGLGSLTVDVMRAKTAVEASKVSPEAFAGMSPTAQKQALEGAKLSVDGVPAAAPTANPAASNAHHVLASAIGELQASGASNLRALAGTLMSHPLMLQKVKPENIPVIQQTVSVAATPAGTSSVVNNYSQTNNLSTTALQTMPTQQIYQLVHGGAQGMSGLSQGDIGKLVNATASRATADPQIAALRTELMTELQSRGPIPPPEHGGPLPVPPPPVTPWVPTGRPGPEVDFTGRPKGR